MYLDNVPYMLRMVTAAKGVDEVLRCFRMSSGVVLRDSLLGLTKGPDLRCAALAASVTGLISGWKFVVPSYCSCAWVSGGLNNRADIGKVSTLACEAVESGARIVTSDCDLEVLRRFLGFGEEARGSSLGGDECIKASMEDIRLS